MSRPILRLVTDKPADGFDPAAWLVEFQDHGGWYVATGGEIHLGWKVGDYRDDAAVKRCRAMMSDLDTGGQRDRLREYLLNRRAGDAV